MKYDLNLFEQLNEEYSLKPIQATFPNNDPDSQFKTASSRLLRLRKLVTFEGKKILEIGCGRGYVSSLLASDYNCSVVGVDIRKYDEWELLKSKAPKLDFRVVDLSNENPFVAESFDLVVSFVVWEHIIHPFTMLKECVKLLAPSGAMYLYANLYRSPIASHRYRQVFFPFAHLLFDEEVFSEFFIKHTGKSNPPAHLNKLTYSHYKEYFRILNLKIEHEQLYKKPLDKDFYDRFRDKLECYPIFDLEMQYFAVLLRKENPSILKKMRHDIAK
jgi:cyclopropane fatty-acyl-phospholipid synthase-like methyltransferase